MSVIDNRVDEPNLDDGRVVLWWNTMRDVDWLSGQSDSKNDWYWCHGRVSPFMPAPYHSGGANL